jgi:hypothetical protein
MSDKNKLLITTSVMLSLLGTGVSQIPSRPVMAQTMEMAASQKSTDKIYETKNWKELQKKWDEMDKVKVSDFSGISEAVEKQQTVVASLCDGLINTGYLSEVSGQAITLVYGENLRSTLEQKVELPCCYDTVGPGPWELSGVDTREELKKKLSLLEEAYKNGSIAKEVYTDVKKDINNRLTLLDKADKYWQAKGEGKCDAHPEEVDLILHLYDQNVGGIKDGKDVSTSLIRASEYIVKLEQ